MTRFRPLLALAAIATMLILVAGDADARAGRGGSFGSRGARTFTPPAATQTAPRAAAPIERSATTAPSRPTATTAGAATQPAGGMFGRPGFLGGLAAGFLGAGLLGMLFGNGLFGGLGGFASILGLILQIGIAVIVARLLWSWWQRRNAPAFAGMPRQMAANGDGRRPDFSSGAAPVGGGGDVVLAKEDYDAFEQVLADVQEAYSNEDLAAMRAHATPEMVSYFAEDLAANASRGVVNRISDVKLMQGDLAESWNEGGAEYATVAMRFALVDQTIERASGRVIEGDNQPQEATELWTFMRSAGGRWLLSAIQQA